MKIILINSKLYTENKSGPQKVFHDLILTLQKQKNIKLYILTEKPKNNDYIKYYSNNINFLFLDKPKYKFFSFFYYQYGFYKLIKEFDKNFFDIAHFQNYPGGKFLLSFLGIKKRSKKTILTVHDWILSELKYYNFFGKITHLIHWFLSRLLLNKFDNYIVYSYFIMDKLNKIVDENKIKRLYIGLDDYFIESISSKNNASKIKDTKYIFSFGALNKKKGYKYLFLAFANIYTKIDHDLIIGGSGELKNNLKNLVKKLGIENRVKFLGFISGEDKEKFIKNSDLIIHPAEYEGYGIAILESLVSGKKVLVGDYGGQVEFINNFNNLFLYKNKNIKSLSMMILDLLNNNFGKKINIDIKSIKSKYSNKNLELQYINLYNKILKNEDINN